MRRFMYDFVELFAPHLDRELVTEVLGRQNKMDRDALFEEVELPLR